VLNRNWQPVNVDTVSRALVLLWNESARVVDPDDYRLYTWADWLGLSPRKRRKGFPSETKVKRGIRTVHCDKLLEAKLGRNDLCPCGSGKRFKKCYQKAGRF
jgi:hypothetical protein